MMRRGWRLAAANTKSYRTLENCHEQTRHTSVSFAPVFKRDLSDAGRNRITVIFIAISLAVFLLLGTPPAALLVFAGGFNGLILPLGLTIFMYVGWCRRDLMDHYAYPRWLLVLGSITCLLTWYMGIESIGPIFAFLSA